MEAGELPIACNLTDSDFQERRAGVLKTVAGRSGDEGARGRLRLPLPIRCKLARYIGQTDYR